MLTCPLSTLKWKYWLLEHIKRCRICCEHLVNLYERFFRHIDFFSFEVRDLFTNCISCVNLINGESTYSLMLKY